MTPTLKISKTFHKQDTVIYILNAQNTLKELDLSPEQSKYTQEVLKEESSVEINKYGAFLYAVKFKKHADHDALEHYRTVASKINTQLNKAKVDAVKVVDLLGNKEVVTAVLEGLVLSNYQFIKYFSDREKKKNSLVKVEVVSKSYAEKDLNLLTSVLEGVVEARDLVNEPLSYLTATKLSEEMERLSKKAGFSITVFDKKKIESLKMGGLLAVNKGSVDPPTFSIMEWKPKNAKNEKPVVLVGKGVVYDTGGLSLKPTKGSMDEMKCDMAGAATVTGTMYAIAKANLPMYVVALVPATDNRPGGNAYVPGDVITMHNGTTVEVLNTDAEGRMLLADALSYAQKYDPMLVLDFATLTGAAQAAIGNVAAVVMGTAKSDFFNKLSDSGFYTYERVVQMPFWKEYGDMIKSHVADIKNTGGAYAGAITAGKFLEVFTKNKAGKSAYPWIHVDIAGPAFIPAKDTYRSKDGTGYGVRLMVDYLTKILK